MKLVIDANVVISALIADSKTRELIVTLEPDLLTPVFVHGEIGNYEDQIVLYLACVIANDAAIWSDDADFDEQSLINVYSTSDMTSEFDTL